MLSRITTFDVETIRELHGRFIEIDKAGTADNVIDINELAKALNLNSNCLLGARIFAYFDKAKIGGLNFRNFVTALDKLSEDAPIEDKP
eukprot:UN09726